MLTTLTGFSFSLTTRVLVTNYTYILVTYLQQLFVFTGPAIRAVQPSAGCAAPAVLAQEIRCTQETVCLLD